MLQLFINDELADMADDTTIALTFQINNLAELKNQQGNTSNQFKLPLTQRNRRILGFPDDVAFNNGKLYERYNAKIVQDGLEIIPYGIAELNSVDNDSVALTVLSGNVDFFDAIEGSLYDMGDVNTTAGAKKPFFNYQHEWTLANVIASQGNTSGWLWPIINYGALNYNAQNTEHEINVKHLRPGFFLKTAIETIVKNAGFSIDPQSSLLRDPLYNKLIVQFANDSFEHGTDYRVQPDNLGVTARWAYDETISHPTVLNPTGELSFRSVDNPNPQYNGTTFKAAQVFTAVVEVSIPKLYFRGRKKDNDDSNFDIIIRHSKPNGHDETRINYDLSVWTRWNNTSGADYTGEHTFGPKKFSAEFDMNINDDISVRYEFKGKTPSFFTIFAGATLTIRSKNEDVLYRQQVQCERIFPDISQKDLLKDTLQRFGIICQADNTNKVITLASFRDIRNNIPIAKNWTDKCLDQGKNITFQLGGYAQVNHLKYKEDESIPKYHADSKIVIADKNLPAAAILIESQFAPSLTQPYLNGSITFIKKVEVEDSPDDFSISTQPRLLINQQYNLAAADKKIKFVDGDSNTVYNDVISVPYFTKSDAEPLADDYGPASLNFDDLRRKYYPELEKILQHTKKVIRYFMLTPRDVLDIDLLIPVYLEQDGAYYYINKIDSWRKGLATKVELIRL